MNKNELLLLNWSYWYCLYKWLIMKHLRVAARPGLRKSLIISHIRDVFAHRIHEHILYFWAILSFQNEKFLLLLFL